MSYRITVCRKLIDQLIGKIERSEEQERNKETKRKAVAQKQQRAKANKLDGILYKRKEMLKKEVGLCRFKPGFEPRLTPDQDTTHVIHHVRLSMMFARHDKNDKSLTLYL